MIGVLKIVDEFNTCPHCGERQLPAVRQIHSELSCKGVYQLCNNCGKRVLFIYKRPDSKGSVPNGTESNRGKRAEFTQVPEALPSF